MPEIKPQPGFQERVLACTADIAIVGGAAGPGKTWALLVEPLYHRAVKGFGATIFRTSYPEIFKPGQLWDKAAEIYPIIGGEPHISACKWTVENIYISFGYLQTMADALAWRGSELPAIIFEELTAFEKAVFIFMLSRNRSTCGVRPYVRASCNPDSESWVRDLIDWYIGEDGFPIQERDGVHRYLMAWKGDFIWGDSKEEVRDKNPDFFNAEFIASGKDYRHYIKSFTFIRGERSENKILAAKDPNYEANLMMLSEEDYNAYGLGNWNTSKVDKCLFDRRKLGDMFSNPIEQAPPRIVGYSISGNPIYEAPKHKRKFITCDAARFGDDLAVIDVWDGWEVVYTAIYKKCDGTDLKNKIELLRHKFGVAQSDVVVDADGVGGDVVRLGRYQAFHGGHSALPDPKSKDRKPENYKNLKTQLYYRFAKRVNEGTVTMTMTSDNVEIFEQPGKGIFGLTISLKGKIWDVRELLKTDLRAIRRDKTEQDGSVFKLCINSKEEQKVILNDRSPDMGDAASLRELFELSRKMEGGGGIEVHN